MDKDLFIFNDAFYAIFHTDIKVMGTYTLSSKEYAEKFVYPEDIPLVGEEVKKAIETTDPNYSSQLEHRIKYSDGSTGFITVRLTIVKDAKGKTIRTYGVNQDITERKKVEENLMAKTTLLEAKAKEFDIFNNVAVNRELRIVELKEEIKRLTALLTTHGISDTGQKT